MEACNWNRPKTEGSAKGERAVAASGGGFDGGKADPEGHRPGKLLSPERRRIAVHHAREKGWSERHACRLVEQPRGTQRYQPTQGDDEDQLTQAIIALASPYGRSATGGSLRCCRKRAGTRAKTGCRASGDARA